jgi:cation diffusion facilitator CzcD-associated flavoprotein CzcO
MYSNLWANTLRDVMTFSDKEFPAGTTVFPFRTQILQYLQEYGEDIKDLVEFHREIERVEKNGKWQLTIKDLTNPAKKPWIESFDAVAVASGTLPVEKLTVGHYDNPFIPAIPGIETFPADKITHAKYFRHPSDYKGKNILIIGNGPSGADLANQLLHHAKSVFRSVRSEANAVAVVNPLVKDSAPIKRFTHNTVELIDGTVCTDIDVVIFCTGYLYSFPMFPKKMGFITPDGFYVHHLYSQTFYTEDPTLVFLGLPKQVIPFPTFQNQAIVVAKIWAQKLTLPPIEVMRKEETERLEFKEFQPGKYHTFKPPEDMELAETWRRWIERDKSSPMTMKPWCWTEERVAYRRRAPEFKAEFLREIDAGKWDHFMQDSV